MRPTDSRFQSVARLASLVCLFALGCDGSSARECRALSAECPTTVPSFAQEIAPIFNARCSSCHDPNDPSGPWPFDTHTDVTDWSALIIDDLERCSMPPPSSGLTLPDNERARVYAWLMCGAPDN